MSCPADAHVRPGPSMPPLHRLSFGPAGPPRLVDLPDGTQAWMVSRYADVRKVLTDSRFGRAGLHTADAPSLSGESGLVSSLDLIFNQDGEDHLRLRRTMRRAFTPRAVARWRPWIATIVEQCLDEFADSARPADLVAGFTLPLPVAVVSRLMGLDAKARSGCATGVSTPSPTVRTPRRKWRPRLRSSPRSERSCWPSGGGRRATT